MRAEERMPHITPLLDDPVHKNNSLYRVSHQQRLLITTTLPGIS